MALAGLVHTNGFGFVIVLLEVAVDGGLEIGNRAEDAASDALAGDFREEVFDGVEPGPRCRGEMEDPARVAHGGALEGAQAMRIVRNDRPVVLAMARPVQ